MTTPNLTPPNPAAEGPKAAVDKPHGTIARDPAEPTDEIFPETPVVDMKDAKKKRREKAKKSVASQVAPKPAPQAPKGPAAPHVVGY
jgi:hypothetical protein